MGHMYRGMVLKSGLLRDSLKSTWIRWKKSVCYDLLLFKMQEKIGVYEEYEAAVAPLHELGSHLPFVPCVRG